MHPKRLFDARQRSGAAVKEKRYAATDVVVPARRGAAVSPEASRDDRAGARRPSSPADAWRDRTRCGSRVTPWCSQLRTTPPAAVICFAQRRSRSASAAGEARADAVTIW